MELNGKHVVILGLARSGLAAARLLAGSGASVTVNDLKPEKELGEMVFDARQAGVNCVFGGHPGELLDSADLIILSPGIPRSIPPVQRCLAAGTPVWAEVELAARFLQERMIGITGSNGKSTTTALTSHLLIQSGVHSRACGNIGTPLSSLYGKSDPQRVLSVELSSFQLESIVEFRPHIATVLNVTPDHMDRYPDFEAYKQAKLRIFENQKMEDWAVINADEVHAREIRELVTPQIAEFSAHKPVKIGVCCIDDVIYWRDGERQRRLVPRADLSLPGPHNLLNSLAAATMALLAGATVDGVRQGLREFAALEHRLEPVEEIDGVLYVNDSKATNVDSTAVALQSFDAPIHLLLGGRDKEGEFERLIPLVRQHVKHLYLIGEAADVIAAILDGAAAMTRCGSMEDYVARASANAEQGDVILMAPGCASFDMYENFEARGEDFKRCVGRLKHGQQ